MTLDRPRKERSWSLPGTPNDVAEAKRFAELAVSYCDARTQEATLVVVTELAENLVKYGSIGGSNRVGTIAIAIEKDLVRVRAKNAVRDPADGAAAAQTITRIIATNAAELYRQRLKELFENPKLQRARLGLLRIAFESGFRLSCTFEAPWLEIVAERPTANAA